MKNYIKLRNRKKGTLKIMAKPETCGLQEKIRDGEKFMYETVEYFAEKENLGAWHNEFLDSYKIMASNKNTDLVDNEFAHGHSCTCLYPFLDFENKIEIEIEKTMKRKVSSPLACQVRCGKYNDCVGFMFDEKTTACYIYSELSEPKVSMTRFELYGFKGNECNGNCKIYEK